MKFSADKHRIMSLEAKKKKEDYLLNGNELHGADQECEIWGIIAGEILQAFNSLCYPMEKKHGDELY